jgi:hypothetical protein
MEPIAVYADPESNVIKAVFIGRWQDQFQGWCSGIAWKESMKYDAEHQKAATKTAQSSTTASVTRWSNC